MPNEMGEQCHKPIAIGYVVVPVRGEGIGGHYREFVGIDSCVRDFLKSIEETALEIGRWADLNTHQPISMTPEQHTTHLYTQCCYLCNGSFDKYRKVADHDHVTGAYLGTACNKCNLLRRESRHRVPILFHNGKRYDFHFLVSEGLSHFSRWQIDLIANNMEVYPQMKIKVPREDDDDEAVSSDGSVSNDDDDDQLFPTKVTRRKFMKLVFLDTFNFMPSSLANLVSSCPSLPLTDSFLSNLPASVRQSKGIFPYAYMNSEERLSETQLPSIESFHNDLTDSPCSQNDYDSAQLAWREMQCTTLQDYMLTYLKLDVLQLADVFQHFRHIALQQDGLEPTNFVGIPGFSWMSAFKFTGCQVDLLQKESMYVFYEGGCRGGCAFVNKHYVERNSPDDDDYNPAKAHTELLYIDANNLYGQALSQALPQCNFEWVDNVQLHEILQLPDDGPIGYTREVNLSIPPHLHDFSDDFPFAPISKKVTLDMQSDFMIELQSAANDGHVRVDCSPKLLLTHNDKKRYVVHYALLKFYCQMGVQVTKIHRAIRFQQSKYLEPFISFNSKKRAESVDTFTKDYYKLKNNTIYGKSVENVRKRRDIRLCTKPQDAMKYASKPTLQCFKRFGENLVGVELL
jgi:hypothetical protein